MPFILRTFLVLRGAIWGLTAGLIMKDLNDSLHVRCDDDHVNYLITHHFKMPSHLCEDDWLWGEHRSSH